MNEVKFGGDDLTFGGVMHSTEQQFFGTKLQVHSGIIYDKLKPLLGHYTDSVNITDDRFGNRSINDIATAMNDALRKHLTEKGWAVEEKAEPSWTLPRCIIFEIEDPTFKFKR